MRGAVQVDATDRGFRGVVCFDGDVVEFTDRDAMEDYERECEMIEAGRAWRAIRVRRCDFCASLEAAVWLRRALDRRFSAALDAMLGRPASARCERMEMRYAAQMAVDAARAHARREGR